MMRGHGFDEGNLFSDYQVGNHPSVEPTYQPNPPFARFPLSSVHPPSTAPRREFGGTSSLFVGDISVNCDEERLYDLFCHYGEIESIQLKKSDRDSTRAHLGFGFIKFTNRDAAARALNDLNGFFFLGRAIRVGWAQDYDKRPQNRMQNFHQSKSDDPKKNRQTAQIHVTFVSRELNRRVSELDLGKVFGKFGNLVDIAIKKNAINKDLSVQSGYAFVHYSLTEEGVRSAVIAVESTNNRSIDHIAYQTKVTYSLQAHIFAMKHPTAVEPSQVDRHMTPLPAPPVTSRTVVNSSYPVFGNNAVLTPQQVPQFSTYGRAQPSIIDLSPQDHAPIPTLGYPSSADMKHPSFPESVVGNVFNSVRSVDLSLNLSQPPTLVYSNTTTSLSLNETGDSKYQEKNMYISDEDQKNY